MNEIDFKELWQQTNEKMASTMFINRNNSIEIAQLKSYNFLSSMRPLKLFTITVGIVWVTLGIMLIGRILSGSLAEIPVFFLGSVILQVGLTAIALVIYVYQLITLYNLDLTEPILKTQEKIVQLKNSTLLVTRILFLQLPAWTTFWWNESMIQDWNIFQWAFSISIALIFTYAAIWLFVNIRMENMNKKWFRIIFSGKEWDPLVHSAKLLKVIEEYENDDNKA